jgi:hypothetical protein
VAVLPFALSLLFLALSFSSFFMRCSKVGASEVPDLESTSTTIGLLSSSSCDVVFSSSLVIVSPSG